MSLYVALDGPDGCGKSSQARALVAWLQQRGHVVQHVREPGSTPVGEALRQLLLSPATGELRPVTEALLFSAARAELVRNVISPALQRGEVVIGERCYLSTVVYQALALGSGVQGSGVQGSGALASAALASPTVPAADLVAGVDADWVFDLTRRVHGACLPDHVLVLDVAADVAASRRRSRHEDRFEQRTAEFHARVREGYLLAARQEPRALVIDASQPFSAVQCELQGLVAGWLS
ncbi:MAG: dTMP kinase [Planctomycetes bacterium]|nr:dTMP kinase [Planctomycetota bacterium]MCC7397977.1 dTMP kinase [Planctomycetota bacterium]